MTLTDKIKEVEKAEIIQALKECDGCLAKTARQLGITERMVGYKIKKYGIQIKHEISVSICDQHVEPKTH